jgi:hypothetical protein
MSTEQQVAANRADAYVGGPRTEEGKANSARNARKHGIFAAALTPRDHDELHAVYDTFCEQYDPVGLIEETLMEKIALTYLRLQRCAQAEAVAYQNAWQAPDRTASALPAMEADRLDMPIPETPTIRMKEFKKLVSTFAKYDQKLTSQFTRLIRDFLVLQAHRRTPAPKGPTTPHSAYGVAFTPVRRTPSLPIPRTREASPQQSAGTPIPNRVIDHPGDVPDRPQPSFPGATQKPASAIRTTVAKPSRPTGPQTEDSRQRIHVL